MPRSVSKMVEPGAAEGDWKDYCERFAAHLQQLGRSPLTVKNYLSDLKSFSQWLRLSEYERLGLTQVTSKELEQYQAFLLTQQKLKPNSVNRRLGALKTFYTWLHQTEARGSERLPRVPVRVRGVPVARAAPLSQEEQLRLLEAVEQSQNYRDCAIVKVLLSTGIRVGELCQLRWADLDLETEQGQLRVQPGKSNRMRRLVLPPDVRKALLHLGAQVQGSSQAPVFVGQRGSMTARGVQEVVKKYALKAGLRNFTPHMLRHTFVCRLVEQKVPPDKITTLMGTSAEMLLSYYVTALSVEKAPP
ncbi:tyrosine-type recombinase/integrase [Leptolyngbya sp. FACHB-321]|nr:tyrosine-type recombinase/integrase [Leptolyngbya sp. FACHB-321]